MAILDFLPTYHQVEPNNLKGLQPGFVVDQLDIAVTATGTLAPSGMFENGHICGISASGIVPGASTAKSLFIHFSEPLPTFLKADKYYAVNVKEERGRLVQLIPGDEWMSDMNPSDVCITGRIVEISSANSSDKFMAKDELADGTKAHHYMFIG